MDSPFSEKWRNVSTLFFDFNHEWTRMRAAAATKAAENLGGARVPRLKASPARTDGVLAIADFLNTQHLPRLANTSKHCFGATLLRLRSGQATPTRETRALPIITSPKARNSRVASRVPELLPSFLRC